MLTTTGNIFPSVPETETFELLTGNLIYQFHSLARGLYTTRLNYKNKMYIVKIHRSNHASTYS